MFDRLERLREALPGAGCDAFFSLSPPANQYLSGFRGTTSALLATAQEAHFLCDFRYTEQAARQVSAYEVTEVSGTLEARLGERMKALGIARAAFDPGVLTVRQADELKKSFEGELVPQPSLLSRIRQIKTPEEIEKIRAASQLAENAMLDRIDAIEAGVTEREWAARLEYEFKRRGASGASFDTIALFGPRSSLPHGMPGEKALTSGDMVLVDCGCVLDGYCSDLTRTYVFDKIPGSWFEEIYAAVLAAQEAGLQAIRPGVPCVEADAAARQVIQDAGFGSHFGHGLGHGVGVEVHEAPRLNKESAAILETGMVVTVEPGIYLPDMGGVRIEDLVAVTDSGCDVLTRSSKKLEVL